jgi:hypothetical protein
MEKETRPTCGCWWPIILAALGGGVVGMLGLFGLAYWDVRREDQAILDSYARRGG